MASERSTGPAPERPAPRFFLLLMAATAILLGWVLYPIASELFLAAVLAGVLWPLQTWLCRKLPTRRRGPAAGLITVAVVLLVLGPLSALVAVVIRDGADGMRFISETVRGEKVAQLVDRLPETAREVVRDGIRDLPRSFDEAVGQKGVVGGDQAAAAVGAAVAATGSILFHGAMLLIALFFFLVRGEDIVRWLDAVSPLGRGQTRELLEIFKKVSYAVIVSTVVTSGVQAIAALVGYYIARVPSPIFFASLTFFVAFIPAIGAASVCVVAAGLLLITGHPYMAAFLVVWGVLVVGLVDNVVKPLLIRRGMEIHGAVVFFALVGGLAAFGGIGLVLGPLVVAMFLALLRMYQRDYSPHDSSPPRESGMPQESA